MHHVIHLLLQYPTEQSHCPKNALCSTSPALPLSLSTLQEPLVLKMGLLLGDSRERTGKALSKIVAHETPSITERRLKLEKICKAEILSENRAK